MPELPEVETVRLSLEPHIIGKSINNVEILHPKLTRDTPTIQQDMAGLTFGPTDRIGKLLIFPFSNDQRSFLVHLKMTGQLIYEASGSKAGGGHTLTEADLQLPNRHTRAVITLDDDSIIFFNDMRLFGYFKLVDPAQLANIKSRYGIEPGQPNYTLDNFLQIFYNRKTNIKALLLNQSAISGLGNIYVDEALFKSGIRPKRRVYTLTKREKVKLFHAINDVIALAVKKKGTTFYSFTDAQNKRGSFYDELYVFDKTGQPCRNCGTDIEKIKWAGRGTHFCRKCQG